MKGLFTRSRRGSFCPTSCDRGHQATREAPSGGVDAEGGEDLGLEGARPGDYLTLVAVRVAEADHPHPLELTKGAACGEVLAFEVGVGELSGPHVDAHHRFQDSAEHVDGDVSPHAVFGVVEDRAQLQELPFSTRKRRSTDCRAL